MRITTIIFSSLLLMITGTANLRAQDTGTIEGTILEEGTNEPLFGANVLVMGTSKGAATDIEGKFTLRGVQVGEQVLRLSYLGYQTREQTVTVLPGETLTVEFILTPEGVVGDDVIITAQRRGQVAAINEQLTSNTIANIVSKDRIQELPDVNAAESIGRLPGISIQRSGGEANKVAIRGLSPKYNNVTINGVSVPATGGDDRSVDLSLISSNMLDGIEVRKANTPDMDADALGGSIDLKLREAPDEAQFRVSAQGGYTKLQDYYGNYKINASGSNRYFDDKLGIIASFNTDDYDRSADKFNGTYRQKSSTTTEERFTIPTGLTYRQENVKRGRIGGSMLLDYQIDDGKIVANSFFTRLHNESYNRINEFAGGDNNHYYDARISEGTTNIFTGALSLEKDLGFLSFDAGVSRSITVSENPEDYGWQFRQEGGAFARTVFEVGEDPFDIPDEANPSLDTPLSNFSITEVKREENVTSTQLNVKMPVELADGVNGFFKFGGKLKWLDRYNDEDVVSINGMQYGGTRTLLRCLDETLPEEWNLDEVLAGNSTQNYPISEVLDNEFNETDFLNEGIAFGLAPREQKMREFKRAALACGVNRTADPQSDAALKLDAIGTYGRDYDGIERYQAAYLMGEFQIGKYVRLIPGVRYESDYSRYNGQRYRETTVNNQAIDPREIGAYTPLTSIRENSFFLPMVHLQVEPNDWLKLRFARTETLTRPDYIQYAPIASINVFRSYYQAANTKLKPALSKNWDASMSVYANKIGLLTVSGFYKSIEDLILFVDYNLHPDVEPFDGLAIDESWIQDQPAGNTYINNPYEAEYYGVEFDWQTSFWYLPSFLSGLVFNVNYTYIHSQTTYQSFYILDTDSVKTQRPRTYYKYVETDSVRSGRMPDQPEHIANATLGYDFKGFSGRVSLLYQSDISTFINSRNPIFDSFSGEYLRVDVALQQRITEGLEAFANFNNINSRPDRNYLGGPENKNRPTYTEFYGFTMDVGVRYEF